MEHFIEEFIDQLSKLSLVVAKWWSNHRILQTLMVVLFIIFTFILRYTNIIFYLPVLFCFSIPIFNIILLFAKISLWIVKRFDKIVSSIKLFLFVIIFIIPVLSFSSLIPGYLLSGTLVSLDILIDPVYKGNFLVDMVAIIVSIFVMFISSIIVNVIIIKYFYDDWGVNLISTFLTFLIGIVFVFIFGMYSILSDYLDLYFEVSNITTNLEVAFFYKSIFTMFTYWVFAMLLCYKTTFEILKKKLSSSIENTFE